MAHFVRKSNMYLCFEEIILFSNYEGFAVNAWMELAGFSSSNKKNCCSR